MTEITKEQAKPKPSTASELSKIGKYLFFLLAVGTWFVLGDVQLAIFFALLGILVTQ